MHMVIGLNPMNKRNSKAFCFAFLPICNPWIWINLCIFIMASFQSFYLIFYEKNCSRNRYLNFVGVSICKKKQFHLCVFYSHGNQTRKKQHISIWIFGNCCIYLKTELGNKIRILRMTFAKYECNWIN